MKPTHKVAFMDAALTEKILLLYRQNDMAALQQLVVTLLSPQYREQGLFGLEQSLRQVDGRTRLKVMEFMLEDGGEDLVPFFLERLRAERNLLYAKSMLNLFSHLRYESALSELLSIEKDLHPDMKNAYNRIVARFRSEFRENFYISEFDSGNPRRMNNAARMMIGEPHPAYPPFLEKVLEQRDPQKLRFALSVLRHLAGEHQVPALFRFIENLYLEVRTAVATLKQLTLLKEDRFNEHHFFKVLAELTQLDMTELRGAWIDARQIKDDDQASGATNAFVAKCVAGYPLKTDSIQRAFSEWLNAILKNSSLPSVESHRLQESLQGYEHKFRPMVEKGLETVSEIAERYPDLTDRIDALEDLIPEWDSERQKYLLLAAKGFRTARARDVLIAFANQEEHPETLKAALDGLALCPPGEIFARLNELALSSDPKKRELRNAAFHVLASWGAADQLLDSLFKEKDPEAQIDIVRLIGEDQLTVAKPILLEVLEKGAEGDFLATLLTALAQFPDEDNIAYIVPYLKETQPPSVRVAAMSSILQAGGAERFRIFVGQVQAASARFGAEMLEYLFRFLANEDADNYASDFYRQVDYWFELLDSPNEGWRKKLLTVLESLDFQDADLNMWVLAFEELTQHSEQHRSLGEKKRLETLRDQLINLRKNRKKLVKHHENLQKILTQYGDGDHFDKVKSIRLLGTIFNKEMFSQNEDAKQETLAIVKAFIRATTGDANLVQLGLNAAAKINDPFFEPVLQTFVDHENEEVANTARKALGLEEVTIKRIEQVFIIDDSRYITKQLSNVLDQAGYKVQVENHPAEALAALAKQRFDLLIVDLNMPEMSGIELLDQARASQSVPEHVIAIASNRDREEIQAVVSRGVVAVLFKPFPMNDLLGRIKNLETEHS